MFRYSRENRLKIVPPPRLAALASTLPPTTAWMEGSVLHFDVAGKDTPSELSRAAPIVLEYVLYSLTQAVGPNAVPEPISRIFRGATPPQGGPEMGEPPDGPPDGAMDPGGPPGGDQANPPPRPGPSQR